MALSAADVELRGQAPRDVVNVLDAVSTARRMNRMELVVEILAEWALKQRQIAEAIHRVAGEAQ